MATTKRAKSGKIRSPLRKLRISIKKVILEDNVWMPVLLFLVHFIASHTVNDINNDDDHCQYQKNHVSA